MDMPWVYNYRLLRYKKALLLCKRSICARVKLGDMFLKSNLYNLPKNIS
jgi:hypothetical protein